MIVTDALHHKYPDGTHALRGIDLEIKRGEAIAIMGQNGAGKSTLAKIISGVYVADSGEIYFDGKLMTKWGVRIARSKGIETVYQDRALAEQQNISSNIFIVAVAQNNVLNDSVDVSEVQDTETFELNPETRCYDKTINCIYILRILEKNPQLSEGYVIRDFL